MYKTFSLAKRSRFDSARDYVILHDVGKKKHSFFWNYYLFLIYYSIYKNNYKKIHHKTKNNQYILVSLCSNTLLC